MKRNISLDELTDGKLYHANDLVKVGCNNCQGCSSCCSNMEALVLDPYDIHQLKKGLSCNFQMLMEKGIEITYIDGMLLPIMQTSGEQEHCYFLDQQGRCKIHSFRPGICRLFPLGRYYHDDAFSYILQTGECMNAQNKVKIKKWLGIANLKDYESYILRWHDFLKEIQVESNGLAEEQKRVLHMYLLRNFYQLDFDDDFYTDFSKRMTTAKSALGLS